MVRTMNWAVSKHIAWRNAGLIIALLIQQPSSMLIKQMLSTKTHVICHSISMLHLADIAKAFPLKSACKIKTKKVQNTALLLCLTLPVPVKEELLMFPLLSHRQLTSNSQNILPMLQFPMWAKRPELHLWLPPQPLTLILIIPLVVYQLEETLSPLTALSWLTISPLWRS